MVDDVKELDGMVKNHNDHTLSHRMQTLQTALLHTRTAAQQKMDAHKKRIQKDRNQMSSRLRMWQSKHKTNREHAASPRSHADRAAAPTHHPRFVRTSTQVVATATTTTDAASEYITPALTDATTKVDHGMDPVAKEALMQSIEEQVQHSEKLENAQVVEHSGTEDPDNKDAHDTSTKPNAGADIGGAEHGPLTKDMSAPKGEEGNEDGPDNGGAGEETPIYKWYKWWNLANWDNKALESMVNSPTHGQLNTDIGGKRSDTNTHGDDSFAAQMAAASSDVLALEGEGTGTEKKEDGAVKCTDCKPFPSWTRKDNWLRTDANFAQDGVIPPTEKDQQELQDAIEKELPQKEQMNDPLDSSRMGGLGLASSVVEDSLNGAMNAVVQ